MKKDLSKTKKEPTKEKIEKVEKVKKVKLIYEGK